MREYSFPYMQRIHLCRDVRLQIGDAGAIGAWWRLGDLTALDDNEKATIKFQIRLFEVQEVYLWDGSAALPDNEVELDANDLARTKHALTNAIHRAHDRVWLELLLAQLNA